MMAVHVICPVFTWMCISRYNSIFRTSEFFRSSPSAWYRNVRYQKNLKKSITTDDSLNANSNEITSIVDSWMKATLPCNVTSVFRQDCFFKEEDSIFEYIVNCHIHKVRSVRGIEHCENPLLIPAKKNISPTIWIILFNVIGFILFPN